MPKFQLNIHVLRTAIINVITVSVALGLLLNRRRNRELQPRSWPSGKTAPLIEIIIPARNEERNIAPLLTSLIGQSYPRDKYRITVIDDGSTDNTAAIAAEFANGHGNVRVVAAPPLPTGWTGKNHAMFTGYLTSSADAEYLLFVDADTRHAPHMLSTVVQRARETGIDLLSLIIDVEMKSFWECVIVPQMGELYTLLVGTMDAINSDADKAAANGQFLLIRRSLYAEIGKIDNVRADVAEDRAIAAAAKARGRNIRLEYGRLLVRARVYSALSEMWAGYSKTLFWATEHNVIRTLVVAAALALYGMLPPAALLYALFKRGFRGRRNALTNAPFQILPMLGLRVSVCRQMGISPLYALTYPLSVAVGDAILIYSLYRVLSGRGVRWKGRTYK